MIDLYLIAHKVRGEPAFDVAERMWCPICDGLAAPENGAACHECDNLGYWWIIPTSGHRAYPYDSIAFDWLREDGTEFLLTHYSWKPMPADLPDHYRHHAAPRLDLATALGLRAKPAQPQAPLPRRL